MALQKIVSDFSDAQGDQVTLTNYTKAREAAPYRIGRLIQNQPNQPVGAGVASGNFWVCNKKPNRDTQALLIPAGLSVLEDILPAQDEMWIRQDTVGIFLTIVEKYVSGG